MKYNAYQIFMDSNISEGLEILEDLITQFSNERNFEQYCLTNALNYAFGEKWINFEELIRTGNSISKYEIDEKIKKRKDENKNLIKELLK